MYFVFKAEIRSWREQIVHAKFLGTPPVPTPHWWDSKPLTRPLPPLSFSVIYTAPHPDNFFTGTIFDLYSRRLISLFKDAGIRHEVFPVKLINRKTQIKTPLQYGAFHLLEIYPGLDKRTSEADEHFAEIHKVVLTKTCMKSGRLFFRLKELPEIVLIHEELKQVLESYEITGCGYTPIDEFKTGINLYFDKMKQEGKQ